MLNGCDVTWMLRWTLWREEIRRRELSEARLALTERWGRDAVARLEAEVLELRARAKSRSVKGSKRRSFYYKAIEIYNII